MDACPDFILGGGVEAIGTFLALECLVPALAALSLIEEFGSDPDPVSKEAVIQALVAQGNIAFRESV